MANGARAVVGLSLIAVASALAWFALRPPGASLPGLPPKLLLEAKLSTRSFEVGVPFGFTVSSSIVDIAGTKLDVGSQPDPSSGGWAIDLDFPVKAGEAAPWLRWSSLPDWGHAAVCVAPTEGSINVTAHLIKGRGFSGYPRGERVQSQQLRIPIRCTGSAHASCGDGRVTHGEQCDGTELLKDTLRASHERASGTARSAESLCALLVLGTGELKCGADCRYDTSGCVVPRTCGNGVIDPGEVCDGANLGAASCKGEGFSDSLGLLCRRDCQLNVSHCQPLPEL